MTDRNQTWKKLPFSGHIANKFRRPTIPQLNIEGHTARKINVFHHLAMQSEALVILLQETHCTGAEKCRHADWGYDDSSPNGEYLAGWASINCFSLLYNVKDAASFYSGRWNTGTNPDLAFASVGPNIRLPDTRVLDKIPRSQHRLSLITPPRFAMAMPSMPVKRWNFRKAKWIHYIALTNKIAKTLLPPYLLDVDAAYQDVCNTIKKAAKKIISREYQNNYASCWDTECDIVIYLYRTFLQSPQKDDLSLAATALLAKLDRKRRDRWSEAVQSIDFSHSIRKTWSILNNLTGR